MEERIRAALAPSGDEIRKLPLSTNVKIACELLGAAGGKALDIGCGEGKFTRGLTKLYGEVAGVDVKEKAIGAAREAAKAEGVAVDFRVESGEKLPWGDAHFEMVAFSNSLHHMPNPSAALKEALRVLKPGGALYVMEPVPSGNYHEATKLVNDETVVRTEAYRAIAKLKIRDQKELMYRARRVFANFEEWKADQIDLDTKRKAKFDAQPQEVERCFVSSANKEADGGLGFDQVFRVNLQRKPA
jgi:ubiquinone/menaquinone biosynthesis C-methylase UbiE